MRYPSYVAAIIERLEAEGFEAYIVGGSVRDVLLGRDPNDYDVTTSASPSETLAVFHDMRTIPTGIKHGTVTVLSEGHPVEVTTFRIDGEYIDSRRPESVIFTDDISKDLSRRDFTVNAMAYSEKRGIIDLFSGREDLDNRLIRAVGDPERRFDEDALRILRAFRFAAQLDFDIESETLLAAKKLMHKLSAVAAERRAAEFIRTICSNTPSTALALMAESSAFDHLTGGYIPAAQYTAALCRAPKEPYIRLAILLCGLGADQMREILTSLKLPNKLISSTVRTSAELCAEHSTDAKDARRFIGRCGELCEGVLAALAAVGRLSPQFEAYVRESLDKKHCVCAGDLALHGDGIIKLGASGKEIGRIIDILLDAVLEDPTLNERETLSEIALRELKRIRETE